MDAEIIIAFILVTIAVFSYFFQRYFLKISNREMLEEIKIRFGLINRYVCFIKIFILLFIVAYTITGGGAIGFVLLFCYFLLILNKKEFQKSCERRKTKIMRKNRNDIKRVNKETSNMVGIWEKLKDKQRKRNEKSKKEMKEAIKGTKKSWAELKKSIKGLKLDFQKSVEESERKEIFLQKRIEKYKKGNKTALAKSEKFWHIILPVICKIILILIIAIVSIIIITIKFVLIALFVVSIVSFVSSKVRE